MTSAFDFLIEDTHDDFDRRVKEHSEKGHHQSTPSTSPGTEPVGDSEEVGVFFEIAPQQIRSQSSNGHIGKKRAARTTTIDHIPTKKLTSAATRRRRRMNAIEALIRYTDATGDQSERRIRIDSIYENRQGELVVSAFCLMRNAARKFFVGRITAFIDASSGLVVQDIAGFLGRAATAHL
jgi:hypothetical protein